MAGSILGVYDIRVVVRADETQTGERHVMSIGAAPAMAEPKAPTNSELEAKIEAALTGDGMSANATVNRTDA